MLFIIWIQDMIMENNISKILGMYYFVSYGFKEKLSQKKKQTFLTFLNFEPLLQIRALSMNDHIFKSMILEKFPLIS